MLENKMNYNSKEHSLNCTGLLSSLCVIFFKLSFFLLVSFSFFCFYTLFTESLLERLSSSKPSIYLILKPEDNSFIKYICLFINFDYLSLSRLMICWGINRFDLLKDLPENWPILFDAIIFRLFFEKFKSVKKIEK